MGPTAEQPGQWNLPQYLFEMADTSWNVIMEDHGDFPLIKSGTLVKLVERLTYFDYRVDMVIRNSSMHTGP